MRLARRRPPIQRARVGDLTRLGRADSAAGAGASNPDRARDASGSDPRRLWTRRSNWLRPPCAPCWTPDERRRCTAASITPWSSVEEGAEAIFNLATSTAIEGRSGLYFDGKLPEARADGQAYDAKARQRLKAISLELTSLCSAVSVG